MSTDYYDSLYKRGSWLPRQCHLGYDHRSLRINFLRIFDHRKDNADTAVSQRSVEEPVECSERLDVYHKRGSSASHVSLHQSG